MDPQTTVTINTRPLDKDNQVSVTSVQMKLRVGEPQSFTVSVKAADNFPLDFYMLMDLSGSAYNSLEFVKNVTQQIVGTIANLTLKFQVGFGTFVDKPTPPFSSPLALNLSYTLSDGQQSACSSLHCSRPVSYEHVVNLTNSTEHFSQLLQNIVISVSSDDAEGTLDAMMQAVVCTDTVGWRAEARKVLFVMTDDLIHTAGDGRLAGIYRPNDAMCHTKFDSMANKTLYADSAALTYDYPTLEQMRMVLEEFGVVPVFAVSGFHDYFSMLATPDKLGGYTSKYDIGSHGSNNLLNIIKETYQHVTSHVRMKHGHHDSITISIVTFCPNGSAKNENKSQCYNVSGQTVDFNVTVNLTSCTETLKTHAFREHMRIPGFGQFLLTVEGICTCDCETETDLFSETCSKNGNLTCGQCECFEGWTGNDCSCSSTASCPRGSNDKVCSGRGSCVCGQCVCHQPNTTHSGVPMSLVFGTSCECDNFLCDKGLNGLVCSGQGTCECSNSEYTCSCYYSNITGHQYEGNACQCSYDNCVNPMDPCHNTDNAICPLCNLHGNCIQCRLPYPSCQCHNGYHGIYCQDKSNFQPCTDSSIQCVVCFGRAASQGENLTTACGSHQCAGYSILTGPQQHGYQIAGSNTTYSCSYTDMNGCYFVYYTTQIDGRRLYEVEPVMCVFPRWAISVVIFAFTLISGVCCIVLVKLFIMVTDYKESNSSSTDCVYENIKLNLVEPLEEQFATLHSHNTTQFSMEENTAYGCAQQGLYDQPCIIQDGDSIQEVVEEQFATSHTHNATQFSMEENTAYGCVRKHHSDDDSIQAVVTESASYYEEVKSTPFPASSNSDDPDEYEYQCVSYD